MKQKLYFLCAFFWCTLLSLGQTTILTNHPNNNGNGSVTFNVQNTNLYPIKITGVNCHLGSTANNNIQLLYNPVPIIDTAAPWDGGTVGAGQNGWVLAGTNNIVNSNTANGAVNVVSNLNLIIPAGTTYQLGLSATTMQYSTLTNGAGVNTFSANGVNLLTGDGISWGGTVYPSTPANYPRGLIGGITFEPDTATHLNFDGVNDNVTLPASIGNTLSNGTEMTIEYWFKGTNLQSGVRFQDGADYIVAGWGAGAPSFIVSTDGGTSGVSCGNPATINNDAWHHLAFVWKTNTTFATYLDGVLQNTRVAANVNLPTFSGVLGNIGSFNGLSEFLTGNMDDVRIWNVALSANDINRRRFCELAGNELGLLAYYKFNQGIDAFANPTITTLTDATSNANNGTLTNFGLTGATSNWLAGSPVTTGSTIPTAPTASAQSYCGVTTANSLVPAISSTIKWYASATGTTALATTDNLTTGTYYVAAVNANGCESERVASTVTVTISNPQFGIANPEILYYKFDGTGTSVPNLASAPPVGAENATILGSITQGGTGNTGGALNGSGVSSTTDYLNTNWNTNLGTSSWSIAFWSSGISSSSTLYYIFGDTTANSFRCFTNGVAGANNWILRGGGITDVLINGGATASPNLCVYVYDNVANNIKAYLNGVLVNTVNQTAGAVSIVGTAPLKVMGYSSNIGAPVGGKLDDFGLFSRVLTLSEIQNLYQQNVNTTQAYCNGNTVANLLPAPSTTVNWYNTPTGGTALANTEILITGNYYATPIIGTCEGARTSVSINVSTLSNAVTQNTGVLTATENSVGTTYQWFQCPNTLLSGETNQTYTPTVTGDYKVEITKGTCIVSSVCETVLESNTFEILSNLSIYPNPSTGVFNISIKEDADVIVNDMLGKVIYTKKVKPGNNTIDISNYQSGIYLLNIANENGSVTKKIIKE